jgi:hypothetical protein
MAMAGQENYARESSTMTQLPTVSFETKCYERDWEALLRTGRLRDMVARNCFPFAERVLYINNVRHVAPVAQAAEELMRAGVITSYIVVEDHARQALEFFGIDRDSFRGGYYYSIQELVGIYLCRTQYLVHFSGASILEGPLPWIEPAVVRLRTNPAYKVANPCWNGSYAEARDEAHAEDQDFFVGQGFSDQCYLIPVADFRARIYHERHPASERYPSYGGELFEKRVDAWMRSHGWLRLTYQHGSYVHQNLGTRSAEAPAM